MKEDVKTKIFLFAALALFPILALSSGHPVARPEAKSKTFAQALVEQTKARHPEADEVGIAVRLKSGCQTIASTDAGDVGEACEKDDVAPMQTGKPYVEKERDGYDVSVPLCDAQGRMIGSLGIGFKREAGQTESKLAAEALAISKELARQIPSKKKLFQPAK
jgi:hypothetical protein